MLWQIPYVKNVLTKFECAEWAIKNELFGFWGGLSPKERTNIRRDKKMQVSLDLKII